MFEGQEELPAVSDLWQGFLKARDRFPHPLDFLTRINEFFIFLS